MESNDCEKFNSDSSDDFLFELSVFKNLILSDVFKQTQIDWIKSELTNLKVESDDKSHVIHNTYLRFAEQFEGYIQSQMDVLLDYQFKSESFQQSLNKQYSEGMTDLMNHISIILDQQSFKEFIMNYKNILDKNISDTQNVDLENQEYTDVDNELFSSVFDELMLDDLEN